MSRNFNTQLLLYVDESKLFKKCFTAMICVIRSSTKLTEKNGYSLLGVDIMIYLYIYLFCFFFCVKSTFNCMNIFCYLEILLL